MLIRFFLVVALLATFGHCADHDTFKDCARVEFCNNLRGFTQENQYKADENSLNLDDGTARINLTDGNTKLNLQIIGLRNDRFRLIVEEEDSTRYKLRDVLDGEPKQITLGYSLVLNDEIKIAETENAENFVVIKRHPLTIGFYKKNDLQVSVDAYKLIMQQNENSKPFSLSVSFPNARQLYGIHEHAEVLALQNTNKMDPYRLRNLDVSDYELWSPMSLYGSIPVLYGHGLSTTAGIFLHNAAEQWYDINNSEEGSSTTILAETASLDLFILLGPTPKDVVRQYTSLTGRAHLPQLWALGYHQCRWNYDNQSDVTDVLANLDKGNFPVDVIWLDIEYTDGKKYFTWNPDTFSDPIEMQKNISAGGRKLVTIIDPHIKVDDGYPVYTGALEKELFVKNADGSTFEGDCWPGKSSYMDFLNPEARSYYASYYHYENFPGSTETLGGIWNDMNEPSVFDNSLEKTLPGDAIHKDADGNSVQHRDVHNIYGLLHHMSTHQGLLERDNNTKRPFILSRSHFAGTQRYSAIWTGDNDANWGHLKLSYAQCLNTNLLGIVFCGADIGGFTNDPDEELLQRWYQAAAWTTFYREHASNGSPRREPYLYSEDVQEVIRNAIGLRYKHLPVWYTLFFEHTMTGDPILRPLFYHYPTDQNVITIDDQLLVGSDIMVRAVYEPGVDSVSVYFPNDTWYSINSDDVIFGPQTKDVPVNISSIPVYYRAGGLIPRKDTVRKSSAEMVDDCYSLYANLDQDNQAVGNIYTDDLTSFNYQHSDYNYVSITYQADTKTLTFKPKNLKDASDFPILICEIIVNSLPENSTKYTTEKLTLTKDGRRLSSTKLGLNEEMVLHLA